jgi:Tol biopolymer transport system component
VGSVVFVRFSARLGYPRLYVVGLRGGTGRALAIPVTAADGPAWSPDGRRLAFIAAATGPNGNQVSLGDDLYVANGDGAGLHRLTHDAAHEAAPAWSPDGRRIVFVRSPAGDWGGSSIGVVNADGTGLRRVTHGEIDLEPAWAPDGRSIVFVRIDPGTYVSGIWTVRPDGSGLRQILRGLSGATDPVWSPDGQELLVLYRGALVDVRPDGRDRRLIVALARDPRGAFEDPQPEWSPDGRAIVFCEFRTDVLGGSDIWVVGADGKGPRRLTQSPGLDTDPSWGS